jgi:hypothetical protein
LCHGPVGSCKETLRLIAIIKKLSEVSASVR